MPKRWRGGRRPLCRNHPTAPATLSKNSGDMPGKAGHRGTRSPATLDQIHPVAVWPTQCLVLFLTIGIRGQHLKIKGFYIKTRFLLPLENRVSWFELYQKLMLRQGLRANGVLESFRRPARGGGKEDSQKPAATRASGAESLPKCEALALELLTAEAREPETRLHHACQSLAEGCSGGVLIPQHCPTVRTAFQNSGTSVRPQNKDTDGWKFPEHSVSFQSKV